jgi:hypothetical protein
MFGGVQVGTHKRLQVISRQNFVQKKGGVWYRIGYWVQAFIVRSRSIKPSGFSVLGDGLDGRVAWSGLVWVTNDTTVYTMSCLPFLLDER